MRKGFPHGARPVLVEWIDSVQTAGWGGLTGPSDMRCVSAGLLVGKSRDRVTLALNCDGEEYGQFMEIPLRAVTRMRRLK